VDFLWAAVFVARIRREALEFRPARSSSTITRLTSRTTGKSARFSGPLTNASDLLSRPSTTATVPSDHEVNAIDAKTRSPGMEFTPFFSWRGSPTR
jgi:hypothetical protein